MGPKGGQIFEQYRETVLAPAIPPQMTPAMAEMAARLLARRSLLFFTRKTHPSYDAGWVHEDICRRLERFSQQVIEKKRPRLMLLMPPRHGKSELASIRFPAWHLGQAPEHEVINVGYNLDLPMRFSRRVRELFRDPIYTSIFPNSRLDPESQSIEAWNTTQGGGFTAAGVGGGITGKGAHVLIVDDPLKNIEEADNPVTREGLWEWYLSTAYTRLAPGGGVLLIECMTGDTPVLMPDGSEKRLDRIRVGDVIATYENGRLSTARVEAWKSCGRDNVYRLTMSSGKVVRANGRHPFLVDDNGGLKWIRMQNLTTAHRIVTAKGSGGSGRERLALLKDAASQPSAGGSVLRTTRKRSGLMGTVRRLATRIHSGLGTSCTATGSLLKNTTGSWLSRVASALSASRHLMSGAQHGGTASLLSTIVMRQAEFAGCSATLATPQLDTSAQSPSRSPWPPTSDFTTDRVASVEPAGEDEVFDVQIERTSNFIANSLISHNTWWNDDDLAGRLQAAAKNDPMADQFEIVKYPALAEAYEFRDPKTLEIQRIPPMPPPKEGEEAKEPELPGWDLIRKPGEVLHANRYDLDQMLRIKATMSTRLWSALYQQNPVPDEGVYFRKEYLRFAVNMPHPAGMYIYTAWDFAIGEKVMNDWNVGATMMQDHTDTLYVPELVRFKGDSYAIVEEILNCAERWVGQPQTSYLMGFEDGQIWRAIKPLLEKRMQERKLFVPYEVLKPFTDKIARARPLQGRMQQGRVILPENAAWRHDAVQELLRFPAGVHDDIVDAMAWAVHLAMGHSPPTERKRGDELGSWMDQLLMQEHFDGSHMSA